MKRHVVTVAVLAAAIGSYAAGMENSTFAFIALGAAFEFWFWVRALRLSGKAKAAAPRV